MDNNNSKNLTITQNVFEKVKRLLKDDLSGATALRISIEGGGCSGFKYKYDLVSKIEKSDIIFERDGVKVVIDKVSEPLLAGSKIDYLIELGGEYFEIKNPNATIKCGCGSSFGV